MSEQATHTPGPWTTYREGERWGIEAPSDSIVVFGDSRDACGVYGKDTEEMKANARLIAAAPDMLEALEAITNDCREIIEGREPLDMALVHAVCNGMANTAIAKARGVAP